MGLFHPVSLGSNIAKGYSLPHALQIMSSCGMNYVEIASISGVCEHVPPEIITPEYIQELNDLLVQSNLKCYAFSGHLDLTLEKGLDDFFRKMELAAGIGCKIINTNSGPVERLETFQRHMSIIIDKAERLELMVGLETHGDIVNTAKQAAKLFREINHPLIRLNYDTGNTFYYAKGRITLEDDILYGLEYLSYIHIKDIHIDGNDVCYCPLGKGDIDFPKIFSAIGDSGQSIACGIEIPVFMSGNLSELYSATAPISEEEIREAVRQSMDYLKFTEAI